MNKTALEFNLRKIENEISDIKDQCYSFPLSITDIIKQLKISLAGIEQAIKNLREADNDKERTSKES